MSPPPGKSEEASGKSEEASDSLISLLAIYATQFSSYTSLVWQVPALALTAQSFLLTIALMSTSSRGTTILTSFLATLIAIASYVLMHDQRGLAISHGYFAQKLSDALKRKIELETPKTSDAQPWLVNSAEPRQISMPKLLRTPKNRPDRVNITAANVWVVPRLIYHLWRLCLGMFMFANFVIFISACANFTWWAGR